MPDIVIEVVSAGGEKRDYEEKRDEYLAAGVREYWIIDPARSVLTVLQRRGDTWAEQTVTGTYRTVLLPELEITAADLFGEE